MKSHRQPASRVELRLRHACRNLASRRTSSSPPLEKTDFRRAKTDYAVKTHMVKQKIRSTECTHSFTPNPTLKRRCSFPPPIRANKNYAAIPAPERSQQTRKLKEAQRRARSSRTKFRRSASALLCTSTPTSPSRRWRESPSARCWRPVCSARPRVSDTR